MKSLEDTGSAIAPHLRRALDTPSRRIRCSDVPRISAAVDATETRRGFGRRSGCRAWRTGRGVRRVASRSRAGVGQSARFRGIRKRSRLIAVYKAVTSRVAMATTRAAATIPRIHVFLRDSVLLRSASSSMALAIAGRCSAALAIGGRCSAAARSAASCGSNRRRVRPGASASRICPAAPRIWWLILRHVHKVTAVSFEARQGDPGPSGPPARQSRQPGWCRRRSEGRRLALRAQRPAAERDELVAVFDRLIFPGPLHCPHLSPLVVPK